MITCFNDAKRVTLSGWSWPARLVASDMGHNFEITGDATLNQSMEFNFNYLTPGNHAIFIDAIVKADLERVRSSLRRSLAVSLRVDGSVDRSLTHNIYVMAHIMNHDLTTKTLFMGFGVPEGDGAEGYYQCVKEVVTGIMPWDEFFALITSVVTDGEPLNLGRLNGFCAMLKKERLRSSSHRKPLHSIWCVPHRLNLAWKSTCRNVLIFSTIQRCIELSTYFRKSGVRTNKLKVAAAANNLNAIITYPAFFEVRWTEYVYNLLNATLRNYRASIQYFVSNNIKSFLNIWLCYSRLHFVTFLADVLQILKRFQKASQSDKISIADVPSLRKKCIASLEACKQDSLENGWERRFLDSVVNNGTDKLFHGIALSNSTTRNSFKFTSSDRQRIIHSLINHVNMRIDFDASFYSAIQPLMELSATTEQSNLQACHSFIVPDLEGRAFFGYYKATATSLLNSSDRETLMKMLQASNTVSSNEDNPMKTALARIVTIKPSSADVERLISKNYTAII